MTDAILAMGYKDGKYQFGQQEIEVRGDQAWVAGTSTLTGSVATMQRSVTKFLKYVKHCKRPLNLSNLPNNYLSLLAWCRYSRCSLVEALEVASLHPARALGVEQKKGTLNVSPTPNAETVLNAHQRLGPMLTSSFWSQTALKSARHGLPDNVSLNEILQKASS